MTSDVMLIFITWFYLVRNSSNTKTKVTGISSVYNVLVSDGELYKHTPISDDVSKFARRYQVVPVRTFVVSSL